MSGRLPPEVLSPEEVVALMHAAGPSATGKRNRALIAVLWRGGLRLGEALSLEMKDVDLASGRVRVLRGKGGVSRTSVLDEGACAVIRRWVDAREALDVDAPLVCTLKGERLADSYVRAMLPRLARRAGIAKRAHAHGFRHAFAHELASEGAPVHYVRDLLGHSSLGTTDAYLRALGAGPAVEWASSREPIAAEDA